MLLIGYGNRNDNGWANKKDPIGIQKREEMIKG
jgi:hypothetical protein